MARKSGPVLRMKEVRQKTLHTLQGKSKMKY